MTIRFDGSSLDGRVRDVSRAGVGLVLPDGAAVPDRIEIETRSGAVYVAAIAWRRYPFCGVAFETMQGPKRRGGVAQPYVDFRSERTRTMALIAICLLLATVLGFVAITAFT